MGTWVSRAMLLQFAFAFVFLQLARVLILGVL